MAAVGGSIESITIRGREFPMTADASVNRKLGGSENEVSPNGNDTARILKARVSPMLSGCVVECDDTRGDHEFLQDVADGNDFVPIAISYADATVYQGQAIISGELVQDNQTATAAFDMSGQGKFTKQA